DRQVWYDVGLNRRAVNRLDAQRPGARISRRCRTNERRARRQPDRDEATERVYGRRCAERADLPRSQRLSVELRAQRPDGKNSPAHFMTCSLTVLPSIEIRSFAQLQMRVPDAGSPRVSAGTMVIDRSTTKAAIENAAMRRADSLPAKSLTSARHARSSIAP